jgi:hypothetical protein
VIRVPTSPSVVLVIAAHAPYEADSALYRRGALLPPGVSLAWWATAHYALRARRVTAREPRRDDDDVDTLAAGSARLLPSSARGPPGDA